MRPITIAVVNGKGGVGKTTLVLGYGLHLAKKRPDDVVVVDWDPQQSALQAIGKLPAARLQGLNSLPDLPPRWTLIDTPGLDHSMTKRAVKVADVLVIPVGASHLDLRATVFAATLAKSTGKPVVWQPSMIDRRRKVHQLIDDTLTDLNEKLGVEWPILPPLGYLSGQALMLEGKCGGLFERQIGWSWARLVEVTSE